MSGASSDANTATVGTDTSEARTKATENTTDNEAQGGTKASTTLLEGFTSPFPQPAEHPEADAIRRQVEYYFSDKNLPTDAFLLKECGGMRNLPVDIKLICSFRKMQKYKPFDSVVEALKKSDFLEVVEGDQIRRRTAVVLDDEEHGELANDVESIKPKKTKRTMQSSNVPKAPRRPKGAPKTVTGFEESFADAPTTPAEYNDELELYDPEVPVHERIDVALTRYKARRRFQQDRQLIFDRSSHLAGS